MGFTMGGKVRRGAVVFVAVILGLLVFAAVAVAIYDMMFCTQMLPYPADDACSSEAMGYNFNLAEFPVSQFDLSL